MYRQALATASEARGWSIYWYDRDLVFRDVAAMLGCDDVNAILSAKGRSLGAPWQARQKLAAAAAIAASGQSSGGTSIAPSGNVQARQEAQR
ncbi:MAG: hypothetical protein ABL986_18465 [Vicinamibacterales bacterium]